ncbi:MAG: glycerol kinase GlpK [Bacilli bacterium]|nr:glycerol kinase GlpK [Bacilli bacterium]
MKKYVLAIDQGTTSSRAILFGKKGELIRIARRDIETQFPKPGWVEESATDIWVSVVASITELVEKEHIHYNEIDSIGITNQRETTIVWDKETGTPVYPAIVWQSRQTADLCDKRNSKSDFIFNRTGLRLNPYFSASKIRFILDHIKDGQKRAENGELLFGTVETWLIYKLTNGKCHLTDVTNASRTMLFNIKTCKWDKELLKIWNIPMCMLPKICPTAYDFGDATYLKHDIPITGVAGDQQAALFGQTCFAKGESKNTYGTGCFMLMNIGDKPILSKHGLLTTVAWQINNKVTYALEASVFMGGATIQWLRDGLEIIKSTPESEELATRVKDTDGVYLVPAFVGLGTPYWDNDVRAAFFGLTRGTTKEHIARASLEGVAYQISDSLKVMQQETKIKLKSLNVDGGASANNFLMQFQSDILACDVKLPVCVETTALGAAYMAGLHTGFYKSLSEISKYHRYQKIFKPKMDKKLVNEKLRGWDLAVKSARSFKPNK